MPVARVMVTIPYSSGVPSDVINNTWHFESLDGEPIDNTRLGVLFALIAQFYNSVYNNTTVKAMANYLNPLQTVMKGYDLDDPKPRTAVRESIVPLAVGVQPVTVVAPEVAAVLSYRTEYESGINKGSQRGRIYLGGLTDVMIDSSILSRGPRFKSGFITAVTAAATSLAGSALAQEWGWVVWSEKLQQSFAVAGGWMDDALDTQRRRGQLATSRTLWTD